jgi:hypothetical protein
MNVVVIQGTLSSAPQVRELASGSVLYSLEVTTPAAGAGERACSVPVAWFDPPAEPGFETGTEVVVVGTVRRRFFRGAAGTQSRTEVVASEVLSIGKRSKVQRALRREAERLGVAADGELRSA